MRYRITTPVPGVTATLGGVSFADGVAEVDDQQHEAELRYCRGAGYTVEPIEDPVAEPAPPIPGAEDVPQPARNASTETWRTWAVEHGGMTPDEAAGLSRDQLADHFAPKEPAA